MKFKLLLCYLIAILLIIGGVVGCQPAYQEVNLQPPEDMDAVTAPTPQYRPHVSSAFDPEAPFVRMAIAPVISPPQSRGNYRELLAYLPEKLDQPVELIFRSTYAEIDQLLKQGLVDVALIGSWSYVELEKGKDSRLLVAPQVKGKTQHHSYIIATAESSIKHLKDLKGEKVVFTDPLSFSGKLYALYLVEQMGETPGIFFSDYIYSYSHYNSIIAVAEGWFKAAAVNSLVYDYLVEEYPELQEKLRIIEISPPASNPPVVVSSKVPAELQQKMKEVFLSMHKDGQGQKALSEIGVESFVPVKDEDYDIIREILEKAMGTS